MSYKERYKEKDFNSEDYYCYRDMSSVETTYDSIDLTGKYINHHLSRRYGKVYFTIPAHMYRYEDVKAFIEPRIEYARKVIMYGGKTSIRINHRHQNGLVYRTILELYAPVMQQEEKVYTEGGEFYIIIHLLFR